jgi:hypothetical protein
MAELIAGRLRVLGQPLRVKLVDRLAIRETTMHELVDSLRTTQQNISQHLGSCGLEIEGALIAEEGEVELGDSLGVGEEVDLDDLLVLNGEGADGERLAVTDRDGSGGAVDEGASCSVPAPGPPDESIPGMSPIQ